MSTEVAACWGKTIYRREGVENMSTRGKIVEDSILAVENEIKPID